MHHKDSSFSLLLLIIFLPLSVYQAGGQSPRTGLAIDSAYLSRMQTPRLPESFEEDKGTVHVFLNNFGNRAAEIREGFINGVPLTNHHEFLWYRISPNPIPPMESGEIVVKLRKPLLRFSQSEGAQFRLATDTGKELSTSIPLTSHPFHFTFIGFSDSMDTIYLYLKNSGQTILSLDRVYLSARDVTPKCQIPEHEVNRGKKLLAVVELDKPLIKGQYVNVKATTKQGVIAQSRVRAFSEFPLVELDNKRNIDLFMDGEVLDWNRDKGKPAGCVYHLFDCPMHSGDDRTTESMFSNAKTILKKIEEIRNLNPQLPGYVHVCREKIYNGCANFGQIADFIRINPRIALYPLYRRDIPSNIDETPVQYLTAFAKKASEPRPLHTITDIDITPELGRLVVYSAVSEGSKGIIYRIPGDSLQDRHELKQEIKRISGELQVLKRFLKIGEPLPLAASTHPHVKTNSILAGDSAIILILINREPIDRQKTSANSRIVFASKTDFTVVIRPPDWMRIQDVYKVGEDFERLKYSKQGNDIVIRIDRLDFTKQIVLTTRADDYNYDQDEDGISDIDEILVYNTHPAIPNIHPALHGATD